jgi:LysR family transcriptional regulator, mexEF-oprN operon transcriptional activator
MKPINISDIRKIDLNLALVFFVIHQAKSVTGAANQLYLTQPAISASLAKLRELCGDVLFVRYGRSLRATPYADELLSMLKPALEQLQAGFAGRRIFEPKTAKGVFRVGMLDDLEVGLLPLLARDLRAKAPGIQLSVRSTDFRSVSAQLANDEIDVAVGVFDDVPKPCLREELLQSSYRLLYDPRLLKLKSPLSLERYLKLEHVLVSFSGDFHGSFEEKFAKKGLARNIVVNTPRFAAIPYLVRGSTMVSTLPEYLAYRFAKTLGLATMDAPFVARSFPIEMVWPGHLDAEPDHMWLRSRLKRLTRMRDLVGSI